MPSGGSGDLEYVWLISYDGGNTNTVILGANGASYDPGVITQTTWYRRCARRSYCTDYVGESNWIKKEICPPPQALACGGGVFKLERGKLEQKHSARFFRWILFSHHRQFPSLQET